MKPSIPILMYHHIATDRPVTPTDFEAQLRFLSNQGWKNLSMDDLMKVIAGENDVPSQSFVLTFDDGYSDNWTHAFPVLQKLSMTAIIYLVTERVGQEGFLSWDHIQSMSSSGLVSFGSHTHTHRHFVRGERYQDLEKELSQSKSLIEEHLKKPCVHLAWPWGDYENEWLSLVKKIGYESAATTLSGANTADSDPFFLKRINVRKASIDWLDARLRRNRSALQATLFGPFNGLDRRFKVWWNKESPYSHG